MNGLPEHKRGPIEGLTALDAQISELEDALLNCRAKRQSLVNNVAQSVARYKAGDEYENKKGARFRIHRVRGDYIAPSEFNPEPIVFVRYTGAQLYKKGTESREITLYPPEKTSEHQEPVR